MKKIYLLLLICSATIAAKAQSYMQGDLNVMPQPMMAHDSNMCYSTGTLMYMINISNSFMGDSVKIKDQGTNTLIVSDVNTSGANPWMVYLPVPIFNSMIPDDQLTGGMANFFGPTVTVISGPDTISNINNFYPLMVSNPCDYGMVSGRVYIDNNMDCAFNSGDQSLSSIPLMAPFNYTNPFSSGSTTLMGYTDMNGLYSVNIQQDWMTGYSVSLPSNYQFMFPSAACSPSVYNGTTVPQNNIDFALQCSSNIDVQTYAGSAGVVRPGMPFYLFPSVSNTGCNTASGSLRLVLDNRVVYNSAQSSVPLPAVSGDTLTWNYANLTNISSGGYWNSFFANIHLTPITSVTAGDQLCFRIFTDVLPGDVDLLNNDYNFCLPVVNSYDPNFKEVSPAGVGMNGGIDYFADTVLTYTVHFQNTGNAPAINVAIIDTLDTDLIPSSLQIVGSSHAMSPEWISPGVVKFNFNNIYLADSTSNEPASHGSVSFRIKRPYPLGFNTQIKNTAHIYFDFNPAIVTNTVVNTILEPVGIADGSQIFSNVSVYPNPFTEQTTFVINSSNLNESYDFQLTDVLGKTVKSTRTNEKQFSVSRNGINSGIYFYTITSGHEVVGKGKVVIK
ncbi:MAG TPA: T9SS type A sorting domain-containing protein [Bacteroidia bacterium]|jgi:uncharacterized repeat protein (TIGR01451 family)